MPPPPDPNAVFLNVPYDEEFSSLYIAYIVGLYQLDLVPHLAVEIPGGERRLNRIFQLIKSCRYSIHDLSRVELSTSPSATPRFNMPLELGMTITWADFYPSRHTWFVWESERYRLQRSASDLNGTDPYIHNGTPEGVLRELRNAFHRDRTPSVPRMLEVYRFVDNNLNAILYKNGTRNPYDRSVFMELCWLSKTLADLIRPTGPAV
ncbi:MAG: hypothetical protein ABSC88_05105 [Terracidiphilus sp.]